MLKKLPVVFVLLLSQNISAGQKILDSAFSKCRNITNAVLRLDCYDQLASVLSEKFLLLTLIDGSLSSFDLV